VSEKENLKAASISSILEATTPENKDITRSQACKKLMETIDWSTSPLGPVEQWSPELRTTLDMILPAHAQIVIFWGPEFIALYNDAYSPTIGNKHPHAFGRPARENWSELWDDLGPLLENVIATGETFSAENRAFYIERFGYPETVYFDISYSPIQVSENGPIGVLCIVNETTKKVVAERQLAENQQRLELVFSQTDAGIALSDRSGRFIKINPRLSEISGFHHETLLETGLSKLLVPADRQEYNAALERLFSSGESFVHVFNLTQDGGRTLPVSCSASPVRDVKGTITHAVWTILDVSEQLRAQALESQLAAIVSSSHDAILSTDLEMRITSWNEGAQRLYGYTAEEVIGKKVTMLLPPDRLTEENDIIGQISSGSRVAPHETVRLHKDGTRLDVQLTVSPVRDGEGKIVGASKTAHDISDKRKARELQQAILLEMKHRVKNVLATVQALARQTFRNDGHKAAYETFEARLAAMARTHDILAADGWQAAKLNDIIEQALLPFGANNFKVDGPSVIVSSRAAMAFSLGLHELATNASKYGALSVSGGRVIVNWNVDHQQQRLHFAWTELDGPTVMKPKDVGFGTKLIQGVLAAEIDGIVELNYNAQGFVCSISTALSKISQID
jgi:PAS domain S-box-containing protein